MNVDPNSIVHPDEDLLTAFAEQALTPAERRQLQDHLADCGRCREVVFLAQQAAAEELVPAVAQKPAVRPSWRLILAGAVAFASIAAISTSIVIYQGKQESKKAQQIAHADRNLTAAMKKSGPDLATVAPAPSPASVPAPSSDSPAPSRKAALKPSGKQIAASEAAMARVLGQAALASEGDAQSSKLQGVRAQTPAPAAARGFVGGIASTSVNRNATGAQANVPALNPMSAKTQSVAVDAGAAPVSMDHLESSPVAASSKSASAGLLPNSIDRQTVNVASAQLAPQAGAMTASQTITLPVTYAVRDGMIESRLGARRRVLSLPRGTRAAAVASLLDTVVALDAGGSVYASKDGGHRWAVVSKQWPGKAVTISAQLLHPVAEQTAPAISTKPLLGVVAPKSDQRIFSSSANAPPESQHGTDEQGKVKPGTAGIFELMNDQGGTWFSRDGGKTWHPR